MRLGQLSRKLSIRSSEIVGFLKAKGIVVEDHANSKIGDDEARMIVSHFAPDMKIDEPLVEEVAELPVEPALPEVEVVASEDTPVEKDEDNTVPGNASPVEAEATESEPEVIKAPKIELQGLKVIGKIELPEPRKKDAAPVEGVVAEVPPQAQERRPKREQRGSQNQNQKSGSRPRKNPIALQREREAREAEERKKDELKRVKESRTQYYLQKVKTSPPSKKISLIDEPLTQLHEEAADEPKTFWGKFVKWLTSH